MQKSAPLSYFVYAYAEVNGQTAKNEQTHFSLRGLSPYPDMPQLPNSEEGRNAAEETATPCETMALDMARPAIATKPSTDANWRSRGLVLALFCIGLSFVAADLLALVRPLSVLRVSEKPTAPRPGQQDNQPIIRLVGHPEAAPGFELPALDGKPVSLESARGKIVLLNFWATWCGPCRAETPDLIALQNKYRDALQIIGLAVDADDPDEVKDYAQRSGINFPIAIASDAVRIQYGGIMALPTTFVLDKEGRIVQKHVGLADPLLFEFEIRALLHLAIPARVETFEDTGQIFLKHANRATELPGVDLAKLTEVQRQTALHAFNAEGCTCGCQLTLAQCRIYDSACQFSQQRTRDIVADLAAGKPIKPPAAAPATAPTQKRKSAEPSSNPERKEKPGGEPFEEVPPFTSRARPSVPD